MASLTDNDEDHMDIDTNDAPEPLDPVTFDDMLTALQDSDSPRLDLNKLLNEGGRGSYNMLTQALPSELQQETEDYSESVDNDRNLPAFKLRFRPWWLHSLDFDLVGQQTQTPLQQIFSRFCEKRTILKQSFRNTNGTPTDAQMLVNNFAEELSSDVCEIDKVARSRCVAFIVGQFAALKKGPPTNLTNVEPFPLTKVKELGFTLVKSDQEYLANLVRDFKYAPTGVGTPVNKDGPDAFSTCQRNNPIGLAEKCPQGTNCANFLSEGLNLKSSHSEDGSVHLFQATIHGLKAMGYKVGPGSLVGPTVLHRDYKALDPKHVLIGRRLHSPLGGWTRMRIEDVWVDIFRPPGVAMWMFRGAMLSKHQAVVHRPFESGDAEPRPHDMGAWSYTTVMDLMMSDLFCNDDDDLRNALEQVLAECTSKDLYTLMQEVESRLGSPGSKK
jgi:hypothetical protein